MRSSFYKPTHWPTWIGLGALRLIAALPYAAQRRVATGLGALIRQLPHSALRIARRNIELCLPHLDRVERERLLTEHCQSLGMGLCETAMSWWSGEQRVRHLADVQGLHHLESALAEGHGAILVGGHFTTTDIAMRMLGGAVPLNFVVKATENALLSRTMHDSLSRHGRPIAHDDVHMMVRMLKRNEVVWYVPDQSCCRKGAVMVNFFGVPAATTTATSRLARQSGARVLTCFPERLPGNLGYRVVIGAGLTDFPGTDPGRDAERFNRLLEEHIRRVPEQYLWMRQRFQGFTAGYPDYYGREPGAGARMRSTNRNS